MQANVEAHKLDKDESALCMTPYIPEHSLDVLTFAAGMAGMTDIAEQYAATLTLLPSN